MPLKVTQGSSDGVGQEQTVYGKGIRLTARALTATRVTSIKVTGLKSGATWTIKEFIVRPGPPKTQQPSGFQEAPLPTRWRTFN